MTQCRVIGIEGPNGEPLNYILFSVYREDIRKLEEENDKLKSDLAYERTMLDNVKAEYENLQDVIKKLNERIRFLEQCLDNKEKVNISLREEIDNGFNRETDLRNRRADSLLENKDLRDKIEELEKEIEELNKMMLFETELEK